MRPPIATAPSRISALRRERDSAVRAASTRSSRSPASSAATTTCSLRICSSNGFSAAMASPDPDDEKPLDPEQQQIVARVRWLMLISGFATLLGIAVVIGVIGYRVLPQRGKRGAGRGDRHAAEGRQDRLDRGGRRPHRGDGRAGRRASRSAPSTSRRSSPPGGCALPPSLEH